MPKRKSPSDDVHLPMENDEQNRIQRLLSLTSTADNKPCKTDFGKKRHKSLLTCVVCDAEAHGYNFDAISCESCKAFFRRNALRIPGELKCYGNGHCDVTVSNNKRCKKCRLEKCLQSGMRKAWILSDQEKEEKRRKIEENRRLKRINDNNHERKSIKKEESSTDDDFSLDFLSFLTEASLSDFEWFQIESVQNAYTSAVQLHRVTGVSIYPLSQPLQSTSELFRIPFFISSMRLITFLKQIAEFQQLNTEDRIYLVKLNLIVMTFLHWMFLYDPVTNTYHEQDTTDPSYSGEDWMRTFNEQFHSDIQQLRDDFLHLFPSSDVMMKLSFLILIFSNRVSLNEASQQSTINAHSLNIFNAQNVFSDLLYKYCLHEFGTLSAPVVFARYVGKLMKLQQLIDEIRFSISDHLDITQLSPLMGTLLL